ncbi:MAG: D-alanyl-D-alanine carboxypeptidase [Lentisphaeria bacterium]|nr:D-alanyl-D-alanine carboxypeptidase [Lentisphaeria bacterium]MBQ9774901.1 D-alanyl-D-alanine carboxypeptidase [Lentisphaeria bacterium]
MNEQTKGRIRIFAVLLLSVVAVHLIVLRLIVPGKKAEKEKTPEVKEQQLPPPPPPKPAYRFRQPGKNPGLGQPFDYTNCTRKLPPSLARQDVCRNGIIIDLASRKVLWEKRSGEAAPAASMVKMMTLLLTMEELERDHKLNLQSKVDISPTVLRVPRTGVIWLDPRENFPLEELLQAITIKSANDAAVQVAEFIGGTVENFVKEMNQRAAELHMTQTRFLSPCGLPDKKGRNSLASPHDLCLLAEQLLEYPKVLEWSSTSTVWVRNKKTVLTTTNGLIKRNIKGVDGLKTGYTKAAGSCLTFTVERNGRRLIGCVSGCSSSKARDAFCANLIDWAYTIPVK